MIVLTIFFDSRLCIVFVIGESFGKILWNCVDFEFKVERISDSGEKNHSDLLF